MVPTTVLLLLEHSPLASRWEAVTSCSVQYSLASINVSTRSVRSGSLGYSESCRMPLSIVYLPEERAAHQAKAA